MMSERNAISLFSGAGGMDVLEIAFWKSSNWDMEITRGITVQDSVRFFVYFAICET
jgi:hypothetical protein